MPTKVTQIDHQASFYGMPECLLSALGQDYVSRLFFVPQWVLSLVFRSRQAAPGISVLASSLASNLSPVLLERIDDFFKVFNVWMYIGVFRKQN